MRNLLFSFQHPPDWSAGRKRLRNYLECKEARLRNSCFFVSVTSLVKQHPKPPRIMTIARDSPRMLILGNKHHGFSLENGSFWNSPKHVCTSRSVCTWISPWAGRRPAPFPFFSQILCWLPQPFSTMVPVPSVQGPDGAPLRALEPALLGVSSCLFFGTLLYRKLFAEHFAVFWFSTGNGANLRDRMVCGLFVLLRGSQENRKSALNCQQILDIREAADRIVTSRGSVAEF